MSIFSTQTALSKLKRRRGQSSSEVANCVQKLAPLQNRMSPAEALQHLKIQYELIANIHAAQKALEYLVAYPDVLGCDIETMPLTEWKEHKSGGLDPHLSKIRTIQFGTDTIAFVFDLNTVPLECLQPMWSKPLVFHNAIFDVKFLLNAGVYPLRVGCTQAMDLILRGGGAWKKLSDLCEEKLNLKIQKELQCSNWSQDTLSKEQVEYAALDAILVRLLCAQKIEGLQRRGMMRIASIIQKAIPAVASMELAGIPFDWKSHQQLIFTWEAEERELSRLLRDQLQIDDLSNMKKVQQWFSEYFHQNDYEMTYGKTGAPRLGKEELSRYKNDPLIEAYLNYTCLKKRLSTFGDALRKRANPVTDRVHPMFLHGRACTGRFATSNPNTQNFPRGSFRELIKPSNNRVFVVADYSQIELRIAAIVANEPTMLDVYRRGEDLHRLTASRVLGIAPEEVTSEQRTCAKAINFGFIYGQRAKGFIKSAEKDYNLQISPDEAECYRNEFFQAYPALLEWHRMIEKELGKSGVICTQNGWQRDFHQEASALIATKQQKLERIQQRCERLHTRIQEAKRILHGHKKKLLSDPENQRHNELAEKKRVLLEQLVGDHNKVEQEARQLRCRIAMAQQERNVSKIPGILGEYKCYLFSAYNLPVQGLGCELMATALTLLDKSLVGTSGSLINCIHDEVIIECDESESFDIKSVMVSAMETAFVTMFPSHTDTIQNLAEANVGLSWAAAK